MISLCLSLALFAPAAGGDSISAGAGLDDLEALVSELETGLDDADETLIPKVAALGTRASLEALLDLYDKFHSIFMRREVLRALPSYDGIDEAEQPALQKLMDAAVGAKARELREAALEGLGHCPRRGKAFLRMVVESPAQDEIRERALELHIQAHDESDLAWYRELFHPTPIVVPQKKEKGKHRRKAEEEEPQPKKPLVYPLESLRVMAFETLIEGMGDQELMEAFQRDPNLRIKVRAMDALSARGYEGLQPIARDLLDNISLPAVMRAKAAEVLVKERGGAVVDLFIDLAKKQEVTPDLLRRRMAELLSDLHDPKVDKKTEKLLGRGKPHQRLFALIASRANQDKKVVKKLVKALSDKDPRVWRAAVEIASERRLEGAEKELQKQFEKSRQEEERLVVLMKALTRLRGEDPAWWAELEKHATGKARELRNAALSALGHYGGRKYLDLLANALSHPDWSTRLVALRALEELHIPEVIGPITGRMGEEEGRLLLEFSETLWRLTGKPFGKRPAAWKGWWQAEGEGFELIEPKALAKLEQQEENRRLRQVTRAEFFGIRIESTRVIFIIDISGSMNEPLRGEYVGRPGEIRIDVAKRELTSALKALEPTALYNIITFSSGVAPWAESVASVSKKSRDEALEFVDRLAAAGGTNLYEALETAFEDPDVDTIIVLSDGEPTVGPVLQPDRIREEVARWNADRNIEIHCVAVGGSLRVLEWIAADSGGTYVRYQ